MSNSPLQMFYNSIFRFDSDQYNIIHYPGTSNENYKNYFLSYFTQGSSSAQCGCAEASGLANQITLQKLQKGFRANIPLDVGFPYREDIKTWPPPAHHHFARSVNLCSAFQICFLDLWSLDHLITMIRKTMMTTKARKTLMIESSPAKNAML